MTVAPDPLFHSIPSNKFCPPRINWSQSLPRHDLICRHLNQALGSPSYIVIEAQAGQGKTTLVKQYLEQTGNDFVWYQIGLEDQDPLLFSSALHYAFARVLAVSHSSPSPRATDTRFRDSRSWHQAINMLLNLISSQLSQDLFIVFDDLHFLEDAPRIREIIDYLIDTAPPQLHFILTSRQPLQLRARALRNSPHLLYLDTDDLAMSPAEVEALYECLLNTTISRTEAVEIRRLTSGWIMGIVLVEHPFVRNRGDGFRKKGTLGNTVPSLHARNGYLSSYFEEEVFCHIPDPLRKTLCKLSFLDDIDSEMARHFTDLEDLDHQLNELADKNFFVYRLDEQRRTYRLHQLFREFLQSCGTKSFSPEAIATIRHQAVSYYLATDRLDQALKTMRDNGDFPAMEEVLSRHGPQVLNPDRRRTILSTLRGVSPELLDTYPWLTFFRGLLAFEKDPSQAVPFFQSCRMLFAAQGGKEGELLARCRILNYYVFVSGEFHSGSALLEETRSLFRCISHHLPDEISIIAAQSLASTYAFCKGDLATAHYYGQWAAQKALSLDNANLIAATRITLSCITLLSGNHRSIRTEMEKTFPLSCNPDIGIGTRITLQIMQLTEISLTGQWSALAYHRECWMERPEASGWRHDLVLAYLELYSAIALIGQGQHDAAFDRLERGLQLEPVRNSDHLTSQFLQYRALTGALQGNVTNALQDIRKAEQTRQRAGGPFFQICLKGITGAVWALLGRYREATKELMRARTMDGSTVSALMATCCLGYLAYSEASENRQATARNYLREWLSDVNRFGYRCYWAWEPKVISRLVGTALRLNVEPGTAKRLAHRLQLAFTATDTGIPFLRINVLGSFQVWSGDTCQCALHDLTPHQRELFGLLISSPQQKISQEQVQLIFWPESPPDKARKSFDTLMSRLRKTMAGCIAEPAKHYIKVEKGYVRLTRARVDALQFLRHARSGLKHAGHECWWQAGNSFATALASWTTFRPLEVFRSDPALFFQDELISVLRSVCLVWSEKLITLGRDAEALDILEKTWRVLPTDEDTVGLRYRLFLKLNNPLKAREVLQKYYRELEQLGWSDQEAEDLVSAMAARPIRLL